MTSVTLTDATGFDVAHRSVIKQLIVTFSESVNFTPSVASAFTLSRAGGSGPTGDVSLTATPATGPASSVTMTFSGTLTEHGSLIDGKYNLIIDAAQVSGAGGALDGNNDGTPGGNYTVTGSAANQFFRHYGDSDGDSFITQVDLIAIGATGFSLPSPAYDFDNDGTIDQDDFIKFRNNFGGAP